MITLKISDEDAKRLGVSSASDVTSLLEEAQHADHLESAVEASVASLADRVRAVQAYIDAQERQEASTSQPLTKKDLEGLRESLMESLQPDISVAASKAVSSAVAKTGGLPTPSDETPQDVVSASAEQREIDKDDYEALWKANEQEYAEDGFESLEHFTAYQKYANRGQIKITAHQVR
jgi:hypothetical protein